MFKRLIFSGKSFNFL